MSKRTWSRMPSRIGKCLDTARSTFQKPGHEIGFLLTKPFRLAGDRLTINADARHGLIKVEATDPEGQPLPGLSVKDAAEIGENGFALPVAWSSGRKLSEYRDRVIRLRFYLQESRLYSF